MTAMQSGLWAIGSACLLVGFVLGILIAYLYLPSRRREKELQEIRKQSEAYRRQVYEHFAKTSELFRELNTSYRAVYDHLARGAHTLVRTEINAPEFEIPRLDLPPDHAPEGGGDGDSPEPTVEPMGEGRREAGEDRASPTTEQDAMPQRESGGPVPEGSTKEGEGR